VLKIDACLRAYACALLYIAYRPLRLLKSGKKG
jgi:hypothetical protein